MGSRSRSGSDERNKEENGAADDKNGAGSGVEKSKSRSKSKSVSKSRSRSRSGKKRSRSWRRSSSRKRSGSRRRSRSRSRDRRRSRSRDRRHRSRSRSGGRSRMRSPDNNEEGYRLHVADLTEECRKRDLERIFMKFGPLKEIWLASYAPFYAFIVFRSREDAQEACKKSDGELIAGRRIRVTPAKPRHTGPRNRFIPDRWRGDNRDRSRSYDRYRDRSRDRSYDRYDRRSPRY